MEQTTDPLPSSSKEETNPRLEKDITSPRQPEESVESHVLELPEPGPSPTKGDTGTTENFRNSDMARREVTADIAPDEISPVDEDRPESRDVYLPNIAIPNIQGAGALAERLTGYEEQTYPSDYEVFLAKSREEYEKQRRRNWPSTYHDQELLMNKSPNQRDNPTKVFSGIRTLLRVVQLILKLTSFRLSLTLVA